MACMALLAENRFVSAMNMATRTKSVAMGKDPDRFVALTSAEALYL